MLFITVISCVQWASECVWVSKLIIDPQRTCAVRVTVLGLYVCLCVCVCLLLNVSLFMWLFMPQTILTFSEVDEGQKFKRFSLKMLHCEARGFLLVRLHDKLAISYSVENTHAYESGPRGRWPFCSWERHSLRVRWLLAIGNKVCLQQSYARR